MRRRRTTEGLGLAFLDIMSCGLGAILLVFMLVKHNVENSVLESDLLKADLARLQAKEISLKQDLDRESGRKAKVEERIAALSKRIDAAKKSMSKTLERLSGQAGAKAAMEDTIKNIVIPNKPDVVILPGRGEEEFLIGLKVEGPRIAILLDSSASMTDERLIDIIRRKNRSPLEKQAGPKWRRAKRTVQWLLARLPQSSQVSVYSFAERAMRLNRDPWVAAANENGIRKILSRLETLVPSGATNLQAGLTLIEGSGVTDLYLITDGLPTAGDSSYQSLNPFADCSALWGSASRISGVCRLKLFVHTVNGVRLGGARVNVIMLPIEGDANAAFAYWKWASRSKGLLISPAGGWP